VEKNDGRAKLGPCPLMALPNLRAIFRSSRTPGQERELARYAWLHFMAFTISCGAIAWLAMRARPVV